MSNVECFSVGTKLYKKVGNEYFEITVESESFRANSECYEHLVNESIDAKSLFYKEGDVFKNATPTVMVEAYNDLGSTTYVKYDDGYFCIDIYSIDGRRAKEIGRFNNFVINRSFLYECGMAALSKNDAALMEEYEVIKEDGTKTIHKPVADDVIICDEKYERVKKSFNDFLKVVEENNLKIVWDNDNSELYLAPNGSECKDCGEWSDEDYFNIGRLARALYAPEGLWCDYTLCYPKNKNESKKD